MFPLFITGIVPAGPAHKSNADAILRRICDDLRTQGIHGEIAGNTISFVNDRNVLRQYPWKRYRLADYGEFTIDDHGIRYRITSTFLLILSTAMTAALLLVALFTLNLWLAAALIAAWAMTALAGPCLMELRTRDALRRILLATPQT